MLKLEAANAFWRLKHSLEKDAFYSTRVRLNVWRSTSMEAGTFDQAKYDEFKQQLYENSVNDSMKCYEGFILEENFYDANICLQTWRMHSKELGTYDKEEYEALKERLKQARAAKYYWFASIVHCLTVSGRVLARRDRSIPSWGSVTIS